MAKSKKALLLDWIRREGVVSSADIARYGVNNFYTSAMRRAREYAEKGILERFSKPRKALVYYRYIESEPIVESNYTQLGLL